MTVEDAFTQIIKEYESLIFKVTTIYAASAQDREDLFQEIVIQLWKAFPQFRNEAKISSWLYRIALNTAISRFRKQRKSIALVPMDRLVMNQREKPPPEQEERLKVLYRCIDTLNELDKAIILLFLEDKSHQEIAEIVELSKSNVGTRLSRIRLKLKSQMQNA
jgi:RNA polymerase sigma-70 factor (ECF subfamily)